MDRDLPSFAQTCRNAPRLLGRGLITLYRYTLASLVGFRCRHLRSCSEYADTAVDRFGLWAGCCAVSLGARRGWISCPRRCRKNRAGICPGATADGAGQIPFRLLIIALLDRTRLGVNRTHVQPRLPAFVGSE